ncbi:MAG: hypothetical protein JNN17_01410 [Verrucomicrobiaceae bacterium]|nr:hypothetical protein [Verrucomicrobiaceae bacterium]
MMKIATLIPAVWFICALQCSGQREGNLSDQQALTAAGVAFTEGNWNPEIFEALPNLRVATVDEIFTDASRQELKKELLEKFGNGPFTIVSYQRRAAARSTNGGEAYCRLIFLVFSPLKVATIDSRAHECPADKVPKKSP